MTKAAISQEEIQLRKRARRRLVGASFLVLVMIVVLPAILDSEPRPQAEPVRVEMPAPVIENAPSPAPAPPPSEPPPAAEAPPERIPPTALEPAAEQAAAAEEPSVVIQLGAFANPDNARHLQDTLLGEGIPAYTEGVKTGKTSKTRVRAGPFESLSQAEKARERIVQMKLKLGMEPKIAAHGQ